MPRALPPRVLAADNRIRCLVGEHRQLRIEQRHVDRRPLAGLVAPVKRREDRICRIHPGEQIGDRNPDAHRPAARFPIGQPGQAHQPAHRLDDIIIARPRRIRPVLPETGDRRIDQSRIGGAKARRVEPELLQSPDAEILYQNIGIARHSTHQRRTLRRRKIHRHRPLPAVRRQIVSCDLLIAILMPRRPPMPRIVPRPGLLDLDHLGAKIGQRLSRPRPGEHPRKVEHADPGERLHARFRHGILPLFASAKIATAALCPGAPVTPPPGCAPDPHRYRPGSGIR